MATPPFVGIGLVIYSKIASGVLLSLAGAAISSSAVLSLASGNFFLSLAHQRFLLLLVVTGWACRNVVGGFGARPKAVCRVRSGGLHF